MKKAKQSKIKKFVKRILNWGSPEKYVRNLHEQKNYFDAYAAHTDSRIEKEPHKAIGGSWEKMGKLQFEFLKRRGLKPHHKMFDLGCGTLRGGRLFIDYLDPGNYTGFDISAKAIEYGKNLIEKKDLSDKKPRLVVNKEKNLKFEEFKGEKFDFILAQSVLTHMPTAAIEELFRNISKIMKPKKSAFYFTYFRGDRYKHFSIEDFQYPHSHLESLADEFGFTIKDYSDDYDHPIDQKMVEIRKNKK